MVSTFLKCLDFVEILTNFVEIKNDFVENIIHFVENHNRITDRMEFCIVELQ